MRVEPVDERDAAWEDPRPRFRVYLFTGSGPSYSVATWDVTEADILETLLWAQHEAGTELLYAVALVGDVPVDGRIARGLTWLVGMDANANTADVDELRVLARMHARRATKSVLRA